jgi:2'-5' RNA ligase
MMRVFVGLKIPADPSLLPPLDGLRSTGEMRVYDSRTLHLTLRFIGETEEERIPDIADAVAEAAEGMGPIPVKLKGMGSFPEKGAPRIVWIGASSGGKLEKLADGISKNLKEKGIPFDRKRFVPHITVARARNEKGAPKCSKTISEFGNVQFFSFVCNDISVYKSELGKKGAVHTVLQEIFL